MLAKEIRCNLVVNAKQFNPWRLLDKKRKSEIYANYFLIT